MLSVTKLARSGLMVEGFRVDAGECVAVTGPSGAGKSLLLRAIADLDPNTGTLMLGGEDRSTMSAPEWRRRVAFLAAESGWWAEKVGEHMLDHEAAKPLLQALHLSPDCLQWSVSRLSSGEKQRLALVRTLVGKPAVLLLDEPTAALDQDSVAAVEKLLEQQLARGVAMLWVTHDPKQAQRLAKRRLQVKDGSVRETPL